MKNQKNRLVTLCGSQGTARANPRDRTLRPSRGGEDWSAGTGGRSVRQISVLLSKKLSLPRKEVIQPHLPVRLPCYDFTPLTEHTFGGALLAVRLPTSGVLNSGGVTGGVYKARERIHRAVLMRDY